MFGKLTKEYEVFKSVPHNMQVLLGTNMLYALVLPIVEIFVGAYIMRNTNSPAYVALYQLAMYVGIVCTSVVNGFLLKHFKVMAIHSLGITELSVAGFVMGAASGFFWTNRYLLALNSTKDDNRNYFFGLESFAFTIASIIVPLGVGALIAGLSGRHLLGIDIDINLSYRIVTFLAMLVLSYLEGTLKIRPRKRFSISVFIRYGTNYSLGQL